MQQNVVDMWSTKQNQCVEYLLNVKEQEDNNETNVHRRPRLCDDEFSIHNIEMKPYSDMKLKHLLNQTLKLCCGKDQEMRIKNAGSLKTADFVYPVFGETRSNLVYGYYFIPLIHPPGVFYVTVKKHFHLSHLIYQCLQLWPLLVTCIALALLAGFVVWCLETRKNRKRFPRSFFRGWFEGVWFSFIFMTPVGFGNTAPKSTLGRLFSVVSILVGLFIFEILAAELTTIILQANTVEQPSMARAKVGVLRDRHYDSTIVSNKGGFSVSFDKSDRKNNDGTKDNDELDQLYKMIHELQAGRLDGFAIDKHTYRSLRASYLSTNQTKGDPHSRESKQFFLHSTMVTDVAHSGVECAYGLLVKKQIHHQFFAPVFQSSKLKFQSLLTFELNGELENIGDTVNNNIYRDVLVASMFIVCVSVGFIISFGIVFEVRRQRRKVKKRRRETYPKVL